MILKSSSSLYSSISFVSTSIYFYSMHYDFFNNASRTSKQVRCNFVLL